MKDDLLLSMLNRLKKKMQMFDENKKVLYELGSHASLVLNNQLTKWSKNKLSEKGHVWLLLKIGKLLSVNCKIYILQNERPFFKYFWIDEITQTIVFTVQPHQHRFEWIVRASNLAQSTLFSNHFATPQGYFRFVCTESNFKHVCSKNI